MDFTSQLTSRDHNLMLEGDLVIIYERHDSLDYMYLEAGKMLNCKHGSFYHDDFINKQFGSKIYSRVACGWIYALKPTPELWSLALHTRTQIVDEVDAAVVTFKMGLRPGSIVVESGTGSGSLSQSLMRAIYPTGHLYTFEYNPARADQAREEFKKLGLEEMVTVKCRDVCGKSGTGGFEGVTSNSADAVFLDLPEPWLAVPHVVEVLKPGNVVCSYSPCIGQVEKTCEALRNAGFHSIHMIEVRRRPFDGRTVTMEIPRLHPVTSAAASTEVLENNDVSEGSSDEAGANSHGEDNSNNAEQSTKKRKIESTESGEGEDTEQNETGKSKNIKWVLPTDLPTRSMNVARPMSEMKGHTAFLTFAVRSARAAAAPSVPEEAGVTGDGVGAEQGADGPVVVAVDGADNKQ